MSMPNHHEDFPMTSLVLRSHLLFHLLRQHVAQINRLGVVPGPHQLHSAHEGEVVCDDLSQLGEVPAVP